MKNFKKLILVVAFSSIVSLASASDTKQTSTFAERFVGPISRFCEKITDIGIRAFTKAVMNVSKSVDSCLPVDVQRQVNPNKVAEDLALLIVVAGAEAVKMAAGKADEALASNPDTADIALSDIAKHAMDSIEDRAAVVIPKTIKEKSLLYTCLKYTALAGVFVLKVKQR